MQRAVRELLVADGVDFRVVEALGEQEGRPVLEVCEPPGGGDADGDAVVRDDEAVQHREEVLVRAARVDEGDVACVHVERRLLHRGVCCGRASRGIVFGFAFKRSGQKSGNDARSVAQAKWRGARDGGEWTEGNETVVAMK